MNFIPNRSASFSHHSSSRRQQDERREGNVGGGGGDGGTPVQRHSGRPLLRRPQPQRPPQLPTSEQSQPSRRSGPDLSVETSEVRARSRHMSRPERDDNVNATPSVETNGRSPAMLFADEESVQSEGSVDGGADIDVGSGVRDSDFNVDASGGSGWQDFGEPSWHEEGAASVLETEDDSGVVGERSDEENEINGEDDVDDDSFVEKKRRRRQLRKMFAPTDDCWEAGLSDEEHGGGGDCMPLEWNASAVRRQMARQRLHQAADREIDGGNGEDGGDIGWQQSQNPSVAAAEEERKTGQKCRKEGPLFHSDSEGEDEHEFRGAKTVHLPVNADGTHGTALPQTLSLPELMLKKRLQRKQRQQQKPRRTRSPSGDGIGRNYCDGTRTQNFEAVTRSSHAATKKYRDLFSSAHHPHGAPRSASPLFHDRESDDEDDDGCGDVVGGGGDLRSSSRRRRPTSPRLSLPRRPVCSFPEEADRKRVVGCLAAVLASAYPYETAPALMVRQQGGSGGRGGFGGKSERRTGPPMGKDSEVDSDGGARVPVAGPSVDGRKSAANGSRTGGSDDSRRGIERTPTEGLHREGDPLVIRTRMTAAATEGGEADDSAYLPGSSADERDGADAYRSSDRDVFDPLSSSPDYSSTIEKNSGGEKRTHSTPSKQVQRAPGASQKNASPFQKMSSAMMRSMNSGFQNGNRGGGGGRGRGSPPSLANGSSRTIGARADDGTGSASASSSSRKAIGLSLTGGGGQQPSQMSTLAERRHRERRHAVLSELLLSSAEMLQLDPCHARAFLPMLEGLLMVSPPSASSSSLPPALDANVIVGTRKLQSSALKQPLPTKAAGAPASLGAPVSRWLRECHNQRPSHDGTAAAIPSPPPSGSGVSLSSRNFHTYSSTPDMRATTSSFAAVSLSESLDPVCINAPKTHFDDAASKVVPGSWGSAQQNSPSSSSVDESLDTVIVEKDLVSPFLETLTPGAGFQCVALLLLNHLLRDGRGYDARVRQAFKRLAVVILSHEFKIGGIQRTDIDDEFDCVNVEGSDINAGGHVGDESGELAWLATRKFEAMEHAIASKLIAMSSTDGRQEKKTPDVDEKGNTKPFTRAIQKQTRPVSSSPGGNHGRIALAPKESLLPSSGGLSRDQLLRGIKITTAGAVGATLFALTGGIAAPGIAAGLAALAGGSAVAVGVSAAVSSVLSSAAAVSTIFGVGGAGLAGYKMHRRTKGLTEFDFQKEESAKRKGRGANEHAHCREAELFSTICISGWLRDSRDFQRPWGISPKQPRITDKLELLERFYYIHNPGNVSRCAEILKHWKGRYFQLWRVLRKKYGRDPSSLFPLDEGGRVNADLTHEEEEAVNILLDELGYVSFPSKSYEKGKNKSGSGNFNADSRKLQSAQKQLKDSSLRSAQKGIFSSLGVTSSDVASISSKVSLFSEESEMSGDIDNSMHAETKDALKGTDQSIDLGQSSPPKHLLTVWDYHASFGGELYTVRWESELLMELCDSVTDQLIEWGVGATKTILHTTALASLMVAISLPYSLVCASNIIDNSWAMATDRADKAGIELAKSLIDSKAGHRPVILVGFSMGARVIYACLKELAKHQEIWEDEQERSTSAKKQTVQCEEELKYIREPASIVEDAILMGTPNHVSLRSWEACRRVIAGRLVNCYSRKDFILSLMFQLKRMQGILRPVCGTSPVAVNGVENFDVTDLVSAHTDYCLVTGDILKRVRHGQPQRASNSKVKVAAMVTAIKVANKDVGGFASLADELSPHRS